MSEHEDDHERRDRIAAVQRREAVLAGKPVVKGWNFRGIRFSRETYDVWMASSGYGESFEMILLPHVSADAE